MDSGFRDGRLATLRSFLAEAAGIDPGRDAEVRLLLKSFEFGEELRSQFGLLRIGELVCRFVGRVLIIDYG
ncbi:MAG: hypothetical protein EOP84_24400 [Verrucomicrobiaceae bacterium]|nr:MAG: hypothetical protein EOP84_24400 [Verrucomicrobiaceae bacterium]